MKIAINNSCNSNCSYCFARNMGIEHKKEISLDDFKQILDWMVMNEDDFLTILGGEPTIHSHFKEILKIVNWYCDELKWRVQILTNGIKIGEYIDDLPKRSSLLINVNPKDVVSKDSYNELIDSLIKIRDRDYFNKIISVHDKEFIYDSYRKVILGCNICAEIEDYSFFWNIVDMVGAKEIRVSVASPQNNKYIHDKNSYFKDMKPLFINFAKEAYKRCLPMLLDCSQIPQCYFSGEEIAFLETVTKNGIINFCTCGPMMQIDPNLQIGCCFGDKRYESSLEKVDFSKTSNYYLDKIKMNRAKDIELNYMEKCKKCLLYNTGLCYAGCFGFKEKNNG